MTIVRTIVQEKNAIGGVIYVQEPKEFKLTDQELREAAQEFNKICKREDIRTQLRDIGVEDVSDEDVEYMADQLIERMEYDESWYWSKVEATVNNFLGI